MKIQTYKDYKILFKITSRERPEKLMALLDNLQAMLSNNLNYYVIVSLDENDPTKDTTLFPPTPTTSFRSYPPIRKFEYIYGKSKNKIDAINRDVAYADTTYGGQGWDILVNLSDDQEIMVKGFDDIIRRIFFTYFPDTDGCPCIHDGYRTDRLITCAIMGRKWYNRFGYIYNPIYKSYMPDNEQTALAMILNRYVFWQQVLIRHNHPDNTGNMADNDKLYTSNLKKHLTNDRATFEKRKAENFGIKPQKILSFCLWGDNPKYLKGALANITLAKALYPDWTVRFYTNAQTNISHITHLSSFDNVEIMATPKLEGHYLMMARFLPASESYVSIMASRDCDSRLSIRERVAVREFEQSEYLFHTMHDHPDHNVPIMGGMCAIKAGADINIKECILISKNYIGNHYQCDQYMLHAYVYPKIKDKLMVHSDHPYYDHGLPLHPFAVAAENNEYVGQSFE